MARQKSKKWSDYLWLVSATYFTLGFFNIVFAWLGVICFMIPLFMAVFGGGKGYCNNYCGRGQLFLQIGNTLGWSRRKVAPRWLSSKWFRHGFLLFFMFFFIQMIILTVMVAKGAENLHQTIHLLWTFDVPWHWAYPVEIRTLEGSICLRSLWHHVHFPDSGCASHHLLPSENLVCFLSDGQHDSTHLQAQGKISPVLG